MDVCISPYLPNSFCLIIELSIIRIIEISIIYYPSIPGFFDLSTLTFGAGGLFVVGSVLCIVECLTTSVASLH